MERIEKAWETNSKAYLIRNMKLETINSKLKKKTSRQTFMKYTSAQ